MSHTVTIKTQFKDPAAVLAAAKEMGLAEPKIETVNLFQSGHQFTGYAVRLPGWMYPVVIDTATGEARFDNYNGKWGKQEELNRLTQLYGVHKATIEAKKRGLIVRRQAGKNGAIQLVCTGY